MFDFTDKIVLITGAGGNLGRATAEAFADAGARLGLVDLKQDGLDATLAALKPGAQAFTVTADLTDTDSVQQMADRVSSHYHRVDVLANVAGGFSMGPPLHETPDETWDFMLNLNARSVFNTCRAVIPGMLSHGGGRIVNVAARAALEGKAKMGPYCASKAAVITLTQSLAAEHKLNGINANCILPGTIDTPQNRADMPNADFSHWVPPADLADVILFLASNAARAVTGAALPVYGKS